MFSLKTNLWISGVQKFGRKKDIVNKIEWILSYFFSNKNFGVYTDPKPIVCSLQLGVNGVLGLLHDGEVVSVPLFLVVRGQLQNSDDFIDFVRHPLCQVISVLSCLVGAFSAFKIKGKIKF